jgi:exopolysaccharide production protein ExoZ
MDIEQSRLRPLDFLRGIAILGVVGFHTFIIFSFGGKGIGTLAALGVYGVQLFFLVSALTMCLMWERRIGEGRPTLKFYVRRFFRIAPPFWLGIIGYLVMFGAAPSQWAPDGIGWRQIMSTALLVHSFWPSTVNAVVPGGWSIGVEIFFYLWFPMLIRSEATYGRFLFFAFFLYVGNIFLVRPLYEWLLAGYGHDALMGEFLYFQFFNQAPIFLLGIALHKSLATGNVPIIWFGSAAAGWLALGFAMKFISHQPSSPFFWLIVFTLLALTAVTMLFGLSFGPINKLGELSYSIYLLHFAVIYGMESAFEWLNLDQHSLAAFAIALLSTLLICWFLGGLVSRTVERASNAAARRVVGLISSVNRSRSQALTS